ncbi:MAG: signal peptidase II [Moraxellaceae bacterium]|nr:signal peptidase II [Pseudobdellovibrionaceae bacterium]
MLKKISLLFCISIAIICLDQLSKAYIQTQFGLHDTKALIDGFLNLTSARNYGAAFGFLENTHPEFRDWFMFGVPPIVCVIVLTLIYQIKSEGLAEFKNNMLQLVSLSLIFGGAVGNYIDRLHYGYVVDFIDVHWNLDHTFPTFNIADCAIVIGVLLLIVSLFQEKSA